MAKENNNTEEAMHDPVDADRTPNRETDQANCCCKLLHSQVEMLKQSLGRAEEIILHYRTTVPLDNQTYWMVDRVNDWLLESGNVLRNDKCHKCKHFWPSRFEENGKDHD